MKKMKKAVAFEPSSSPAVVVYEDARTRFKHQSLMQDYEELEKETESMKSKLQAMQQKRLTLLAEVRFLRRRFNYLTEKQPIIQQQQQQQQQSKRSNVNILKGKKNSKKESTFRYPPTPLESNRKDAEVVSAATQKAAPILFDLNQKARSLGAKEFTFQTPRPALDLNQQDLRIHAGKESAKRKNVPFFDLNQISGEEEELMQDHCVEPLLACRSIENGPSRSGKRKITWQDQVALRV